MNTRAEEAIAIFLTALGIDCTSAEMKNTPKRVAALYEELFSGVGADTTSLWTDVYPTDFSGLISITSIPFYSICEHHLVPFSGLVDIVYKPVDGRVVGLSKLTDLVHMIARKPQLQERMSKEIADTIAMELGAEGVIVRIQAEHFCMIMGSHMPRGASINTIESRGVLQDDGPARNEALILLNGGKENV